MSSLFSNVKKNSNSFFHFKFTRVSKYILYRINCPGILLVISYEEKKNEKKRELNSKFICRLLKPI